MAAATEIAPELGIAPTCEDLGLGRATFYRWRHPRPDERIVSRPQPPRALKIEERQEALDTLHSERFIDQAPPRAVYATLLDEGAYRAHPAPCIAYWPRKARSKNGGTRSATHITKSPSCWPIRSGPGTSPSSWGRSNGPIFTSMSSWTSSAAMWWAGWWRRG